MSGLILTLPPHVHSGDSVPRRMGLVLAGLLPAAAAAAWLFGPRALAVMAVCLAGAMGTEALIRGLRGLPCSLPDGSAAVTGLLLAFNLPPSIPLWMAATGAAVAVGIAKEAFGGLGCNIFNPALVGRAFLLASWPAAMTRWHLPEAFRAAGVDAVTTATPLRILKEHLPLALPDTWHLLLGDRAGCLGEGCLPALLAGAALLLVTRVITWHIPAAFLGAAAALLWLFPGADPAAGAWASQMLSGGLVLGAFFMATDYPTSPSNTAGKLVFGLGCGVLTFVIRRWGGYPEGVCYAILMMNAAAPLIERHTRPAFPGAGRKGGKTACAA